MTSSNIPELVSTQPDDACRESPARRQPSLVKESGATLIHVHNVINKEQLSVKTLENELINQAHKGWVALR
eukprot:m.31848 g.31848  ORF g.31848 m.31848 type:complete len:71 (+) comp10725_c0_seq2:26-238(+)